MKQLKNNRGHGPMIGTGMIIGAIVTAPIWGPIYLLYKGYDKVKFNILDYKFKKKYERK